MNIKNYPSIFIIILMTNCSGPVEQQIRETDDNSIVYLGDSLRNIAVPLGGIGTGDVLVGGRGNILALELFNRAARTGELPYMTFFSIWSREKGQQPVSRVLEARVSDDAPGPYGIERRQLAGLPRFENVEFVCNYPLVQLRLRDKNLPLDIKAEFYNPFIPLDVDNSSLPVVRFNWKITNTSSERIAVSIAFNLSNPLMNSTGRNFRTHEGNRNRYYEDKNLKGIYMLNEEEEDSPLNGNLLMATTFKDPEIQTAWYEGAWWDDATIFWDDFAADGHVEERHEEVVWRGSDWYGSDRQTIVGNITSSVDLDPGETAEIPYYLAWYVPNRVLESTHAFGNKEVEDSQVRNFYSTKFSSSDNVMKYYLEHEDRLLELTGKYVNSLYQTTIPAYAIDAVAANTAILKSTLLMRTGEGWVHGFEGMGPTTGCCPGNCTHVWNYAQTMASLFPELEMKVREVSFMHDTHPNGYQCFRTVFPLSDNWFKSVAADGQMGNIMRVYREWKNTGDSVWLAKLWPKVKLALEFAWKGSGEVQGKYAWQEHAKIPWDPQKEGVMRGKQHNTYDIDFFGPNMMTGSLYLGALKACAEMADYMNEQEKAMEYTDLYQKGKENYEALLWNGSYFIQQVEVIDGIEIPERLKSPPDQNGKIIPKYQFGNGCLTDQLLGQYLAFNSGLGYIVDSQKVKKAMKSIFTHNYIPDFSEISNVQRVFAVNKEGGMVIGTWPNGNRPRIPFVYADEVWTGVEYEAAANMIWAGLVEEGLRVVETLRNRYRGFNRNPWGEIESGMFYARAMASWSVLLSLTGFEYDGNRGYMKFDPKTAENSFICFWSCGNGWGIYEQRESETVLEILFGEITLDQIEVPFTEIDGIHLDDREVGYTILDKRIIFDSPLRLMEGTSLKIF